mmetsp:Transcript_21866/g.58964  ORF Transcript_21866/g.58964 Transcript_21866/m.58964 type:complete len:218 (+) Transcript_21866:132-785(+)
MASRARADPWTIDHAATATAVRPDAACGGPGGRGLFRIPPNIDRRRLYTRLRRASAHQDQAHEYAAGTRIHMAQAVPKAGARTPRWHEAPTRVSPRGGTARRGPRQRTAGPHAPTGPAAACARRGAHAPRSGRDDPRVITAHTDTDAGPVRGHPRAGRDPRRSWLVREQPSSLDCIDHAHGSCVPLQACMCTWHRPGGICIASDRVMYCCRHPATDM